MQRLSRFLNKILLRFKLPKFSYSLLPLVAVIIIIASFLGVLFAPQKSSAINWWLAAFVGAFFLGLVVFYFALRNSIIDRIAPFVMSPYGPRDAAFSRRLLFKHLFGWEEPTLIVLDGEISPKTESSLFKETLIGPGKVEIDWESAMLVEKGGKFRVIQGGNEHPLDDKERILDIVDLRPQKESFDLAAVSTRDGIFVRVRGVVFYQVEQDTRHLFEHRSHATTLEVLRRAVMPRNEWKQKTKGSIEPMIRDTLRQYDLGELFIREPQLAPLDLSAQIGGLAQRLPAPIAFSDMQSRVKQNLNELCRSWGVQVTIVKIEEIVPPVELTERAMRAYQVWLEREAELQRIETRARMAQREAEAEREIAAIQRDTEMIRTEAHAVASRTNAGVEKDTTILRAEMDAQARRILADADQHALMVRAQAEADAHRLRMDAVGETGMDVARRIDLLTLMTGKNLDDVVLREFLRAIGLLKVDAEHGDEQPSRLIQIREIGGDSQPAAQ